MGKIRSEKARKLAHELLKKHPDKFTTDFEENRKVMASLAEIPSTKLKNTIAGCITRLVVRSQSEKTSQEKSSQN